MSLSDDSCCNKTKAFLELLLLSNVRDADSLCPSCLCNPIRFYKLCKGSLEAMAEIKYFQECFLSAARIVIHISRDL